MNDFAAGIRRMTGRLRRWIDTYGLALALAATAFTAAGCGSSFDGGSGVHPDYDRALAGAPPPLAALYEQANRLLPGGLDAYEERLAALHGHPVVVNVWASWCGPCRFEFPHFQKAAAKYGKRVAFLGVDSQDADEEAARFLREEPLPYPSYKDPDEEIGDELGTSGLPATAFYNRRGELVFLQHKPYVEDGEIDADIERYALGRDGEGG
jgi:cytochrome c biogenesis protein CcmG/thiol:disulfide interchange protein DsbE